MDENLTKLTTLFFDRLLTRIEEKMANGDKKEAEELDELAQSALVVVESRATFERASEVGFPETLRDSISAHEATLKKQLADGSVVRVATTITRWKRIRLKRKLNNAGRR